VILNLSIYCVQILGYIIYFMLQASGIPDMLREKVTQFQRYVAHSGIPYFVGYIVDCEVGELYT
jgi:hypothetical protein